MTVAVAVCCAEGAVVAVAQEPHDRPAPGSAAGRVFPLGTRGTLVTLGSDAATSDIWARLGRGGPSRENLRDPITSVGRVVAQVRDHHYKAYVRNVPWFTNALPTTSVMACGVDACHSPWIVEVDTDALTTRYTELGFHAIADEPAAARMARNLLAAHADEDRRLSQTIVIAMHIATTVAGMAASDLGCQQVWCVDKSGCRELHDEALGDIGDRIEQWRRGERSRLLRLG